MAFWNWTDARRTYLRGYNALDLIHEAIYEGRPVGRRLTSAANDFLRKQKFASSYLNILQSMVDTVVSRQSKRRPQVVIGCDDAEYSEKLYAKRASRVFRKKLTAPDIERMRPMQIRDAVVRGDGLIKVFRNGNDVDLERVPRSEIVFDDAEAVNGWPQTLAQVKRIDRDQLAAMFPEARKRIMKLQPASRDAWSPYDYDMPIDNSHVEVCEGWHLPSIPGAEDGRHCIAVRDGGEPLCERMWTRPRHPFGRIQWTPPMRGFLGIGLVQQLAGSQNKVNELWADHQEALYWGSALKVFTQRQANVDKNHMRARHPAVIETDGPVPTFVAPNPASVQAMESIRWTIQQMYEISGISQASAASKSPMGPAASGKAIETVYDIESDRFAQFEGQVAQATVDLGLCILDEAKEMKLDYDSDESDEKDELAPWVKRIDWKRFDFEDGGYHLAPEPVGFLPDSRGGKLEALNDLAKIPGLFTNPMQMASLFDEPDIARANRHLLGPYRMLEKVMEMLGDEDIPEEDCTPTPYMLSPPGLAKEMCEGELGNAYAEEASDEVIGRYRWFLGMLLEVEEQQKAAVTSMAAPPMPDPNAMPPGGPMGAGGPGLPGLPPGAPPAPLAGGILPDPMAGATSQLAAGMPLPIQGGADIPLPFGA